MIFCWLHVVNSINITYSTEGNWTRPEGRTGWATGWAGGASGRVGVIRESSLPSAGNDSFGDTACSGLDWGTCSVGSALLGWQLSPHRRLHPPPVVPAPVLKNILVEWSQENTKLDPKQVLDKAASIDSSIDVFHYSLRQQTTIQQIALPTSGYKKTSQSPTESQGLSTSTISWKAGS